MRSSIDQKFTKVKLFCVILKLSYKYLCTSSNIVLYPWSDCSLNDEAIEIVTVRARPFPEFPGQKVSSYLLHDGACEHGNFGQESSLLITVEVLLEQ